MIVVSPVIWSTAIVDFSNIVRPQIIDNLGNLDYRV